MAICEECNGEGARGVFGPAGLGLFSTPCPKCQRVKKSSSGGQKQNDIIDKVGTAIREIRQDIQRGGTDLVQQISAAKGSSTANRKTEEVKDLGELALEYSWEEVRNATEEFSEKRRLGAGAWGVVFRGTLQEGTDVAIKVIEGAVGTGFEEEVRLLSRCRHPNVVMLLGFACESGSRTSAKEPQASGGRRALVYELLSGGDVESRLHNPSGKPFTWQDRLRTAIDMVRGLAHLHKHRPEVFHRDIKPPNVLFGADGVARIADFGLACVSKRSGVRSASVDSAGTPGYADPLYARTGVVTEASEVYSMGIVLLELLTRRRPAWWGPDGETIVYLVNELQLLERGANKRLLGMLDAQACWPRELSTSLINISLLCIHSDVDQRPSFIDLACLLQELSESFTTRANCSAPLSSLRTPSAWGEACPRVAPSPIVNASPPVQHGLPGAPLHLGQQTPYQASDGGAQWARSKSFAESAQPVVRPLDEGRISFGNSFSDGHYVQAGGRGGFTNGVGQPYVFQAGAHQSSLAQAGDGLSAAFMSPSLAPVSPMQPISPGPQLAHQAYAPQMAQHYQSPGPQMANHYQPLGPQIVRNYSSPGMNIPYR